MAVEEATEFDFEAFKRANAEHDVEGILERYAADAEVQIADKENTPSAPMVLKGKDAIRGLFEDIASRGLTHTVEQELVGDNGAAFSVRCRYPDGTNVLYNSMVELKDGKIARERAVQAWDE